MSLIQRDFENLVNTKNTLNFQKEKKNQCINCGTQLFLVI